MQYRGCEDENLRMKWRLLLLALCVTALAIAFATRGHLPAPPSTSASFIPFFIGHGLVIAIFALVISRAKAFPFRAMLKAAGGWQENIWTLGLALVPAIAAVVFLQTQVVRISSGHSYQSASWQERDGHYFARYDNAEEQEISREQYDEQQVEILGDFQRFWVLFLALASCGAWAMVVWPGSGAALAGTAALASQQPWWSQVSGALLRNPIQVIWREEPARIAVPGIGSIALERLRERVPRVALFKPFRETCVGRVGTESLRLRYYRPWNRSEYGPVLDARLVGEPSGQFLIGVYRTAWGTRIATTFMLVMVGLMFLIGTLVFIFTANGREDRPFGLLWLLSLIIFALVAQLMLAYKQRHWDRDRNAIEQFVLDAVQTSDARENTANFPG